MQGTRTVVLDDIISWAVKPVDRGSPAHSSSSDNIFWLYGMPGLGKTSVANSLCHLLHNQRKLGGSFFCRRDDPILREPKRVLPTLIYRLAGMWSPYATLVAQALRDDPQLSSDSTRDELLIGPLKALQKHPTRTLVLAVDALDECGEPATRRALLRCLLSACSSVVWLKVIITSRPEHDITSFFDKNNIANRRDLAMDAQASKDIRLFARTCMSSVGSNRHLPSDWPGDKRLDQIVERSGGLFIFVETLYRLIDDPDPEPLLAQVLDGESEGAKTELHKLYSTAIISPIGRRTDAFRSIIQAIVVVSTYRPLRDETLASLIGLEPRIVRSWVNELSSLLYRDGAEKDGVRVRHLSVLEFLTGPTCPPEYRVDLKRANAELGLRCLMTMTKELKFNICELETSCLFNSEIQDLGWPPIQHYALVEPSLLRFRSGEHGGFWRVG
jgi:NACHT domain